MWTMTDTTTTYKNTCGACSLEAEPKFSIIFGARSQHFIIAFTKCIDVLLSQRPHVEQESHVILLNFARNSVREVFLVHFLDF
jgi:hypothetical protein